MTQAQAQAAALDALTRRVTGPVIRPGADGYEEARRVYNGMIDRRPAAVVRCATASDVAAVVGHAAENDLDLAVRGGGHSVPGFGTVDGGVVADLSPMQRVDVDPPLGRPRAGGGATWGGFNDGDRRPRPGRPPAGSSRTTGIAGLTLGGGIGYLARGHGLSCDNLVSAEVVTADGQIVTASEEENPDLFWALRGGGGNFGVVTDFTYRLHPVGDLRRPDVLRAGRRGRPYCRFYRRLDRRRAAGVRRLPGVPDGTAAAVHPRGPGREPFAAVVSCWTGDLEEGAALLRPFREVAPARGDGRRRCRTRR